MSKPRRKRTHGLTLNRMLLGDGVVAKCPGQLSTANDLADLANSAAPSVEERERELHDAAVYAYKEFFEFHILTHITGEDHSCATATAART
ncbi:hypothetical protein LCGC14_1873200 [marine sediment metagenome]|uniref:Uncharacterized protein n=1 Tax=marine sediment metagenome TaxID=412755 RepID=A0A0F9G4I6_9ZZZZ